ncbi:hypothetical protein MHU86_14424 [Fragilaria crotonensis]|nr:hypothetical protein MHU86_14424 [Fragilaria crotonensis]
MTNKAQQSGDHLPVSTCQTGVSYAPPSLKSNNYARLPVDDDDFGTSTFSDLDDDREQLFTDAVDATLNNEESEHPVSNVAPFSDHPDRNVAPFSDNSESPLTLPNTFGDAWSREMMMTVSTSKRFLWKRRSRWTYFRR